MRIKNSETLIEHYNQAFNELYTINSLINILKISCEEKEYKGNYYNVSTDVAKLLSNERNEYINILSLISEKVAFLIKQYISIENELT